MARLSMGGWSLCRASLVFRVRGRVRVLGLGFCVRVKVSITGSVSYLNENCSLRTLLLSAPAIHRRSLKAQAVLHVARLYVIVADRTVWRN